MKILLLYYTGTFNTRYLSRRLAARFEKEGHETTLVEINAKTPPIATDGYDLIGFGYPIYGFNSPLPFNQYIKKLRFQAGQPFFIYKNSGETFAMNNASSRILLRLMKRSGAILRGEYHFVMPYNIHFRFDDNFVREILSYNEKLTEIMLYNLKAGTVQRIKSNPIYDLGAFFVGIQKIGGNVNSFLYKADPEKCNGCGLCVRQCPHQNISQREGKIVFSHHCDMCMRCSFFCPTNAIHIGFLEGWKVNGAYDYNKLQALGPPEAPYITKDSRGFYKCFIKYFAAIDAAYEALPKEETALANK